MNGVESREGVIDSGALEKVFQELEAGTLPEDDRDALMRLLERSPAAQTSYLEYFEMSAMLGAEAAAHAEQGRLPVVSQSQLPMKFFRRSLLAAAALLLFGAVIASLFVAKQPKSLLADATEGAIWTVNGEPQDSGSDNLSVDAGSIVHVRSGTLRLGFESGAAMVIQSPARVYFPELEKPVVSHGWLWIDSSDSEQHFEVTTPKLLVRDIGTRFAVRVPGQGPGEIHLIEGKVEVFAKSTDESIALLEPEEKGYAVYASGELIGLELASDPFPGLSELLAAPADYENTVKSQNPTDYWRMGDGDLEVLANEIVPESAGRRHVGVTDADRGPGPSDGFKGFRADNISTRLSGKAVRAPISLGATPVHAGLLFREDFGGEGALHGSSPSGTVLDAKWIAAPVIAKNGTLRPGSGSATLAFTPVDGVVYTLDASLRDLSGAGSWAALGFANGQSKEADTTNRFISQKVVGRAWVLFRANLAVAPNSAFIGSSGTNGGLADEKKWAGPLADLKGDMDLRVVLDTSEGPGAWKATWYAKRPDEESYKIVRATRHLLNEEIWSVGIAVNGSKTSGRVTAFSLNAEPVKPAETEANLASAPASVSRKEGAVSFWIRRDPGASDREIIWSAGESTSDAAFQAHLEPDGRVGFFVENGRFDILLTSEEGISTEKWHHVVTSWNPSSVNLYIDGKAIASSSEFRGIRQGILSELRFGNGVPGPDGEPFSGWIDEIAFWNRALSLGEVGHQFRSALGK